MFILQTVVEFLVAGFIIWGLFNEKRLVKFEDRVFDAVKRLVKKSARRRNIYRSERHRSCNADRTCA